MVKLPKLKSFPMASENLGSIISVSTSFNKHPSIVKIITKSLNSTSYFKKKSVMKLEGLLVISILKSLVNKKIFPLRSLN